MGLSGEKMVKLVNLHKTQRESPQAQMPENFETGLGGEASKIFTTIGSL
jgi:hypothetical protein